jgi:hypothetical protein
MDYKKHYDDLILRAKSRALIEGYSEKHHIIPKCMGGDNSEDNLVILRPEEHYVAHQLLVKIYPNEYKLVYALHIMTVDNRHHGRFLNKEYAWVRRAYSEAMSGRTLSAEHRRNIGLGNIGKRKGLTYEDQYGKEKAEYLRELKSQQLSGRKLSDETCSKMSESKMGHAVEPETIEKIREIHIGSTRSETTRLNISKSLTGRTLSEEHKRKIAESKQRKRNKNVN